jgi:predicted transposase YbfD/YdcC
MQALADTVGLRHIAIDGKSMRGSAAAGKGWGPLHIVSAWATANHLALGQVAVDSKSNEITAIPQLLELLDLHGALVTIDAMGCQKAIAQKIVDGGGDYVLTVKDNQENLLSDIKQALMDACEKDFVGMKCDTYQCAERNHGRDEFRCYTVLESTTGIRNAEAWAGLTTIGVATVRGRSTAKPAKRRATSWVPGPRVPEHTRKRCGIIGASKTTSTGNSMSPLAKTAVASALATAPRTLACCENWRWSCSNAIPAKKASPANACTPPWTSPFWRRSSAHQ